MSNIFSDITLEPLNKVEILDWIKFTDTRKFINSLRLPAMKIDQNSSNENVCEAYNN